MAGQGIRGLDGPAGQLTTSSVVPLDGAEAAEQNAQAVSTLSGPSSELRVLGVSYARVAHHRSAHLAAASAQAWP